MTGDNGVAFKVDMIIDHSQKLEDDIKKLGLQVKNQEDYLEFYKSEIQRVDECIHKTLVKLGPRPNPSVAVEENINTSSKETMDDIIALGSSAAGIICQLRNRCGLQASTLPLTKDVLGVVATLGEVNDDRLSRSISEFLGLETMLAIVCKSYEGVKALEKYDSEGRIDLSAGLHGLGPFNGRFLVYCLDELSAYKGDFIPGDPQRRLALQNPRFRNGESPQGFLGFAINMINVDHVRMPHATIDKKRLRNTLFFHLLSDLQVYETRGQMQSALSCVCDGAISLDGGMIRKGGVFALGDRSNVAVKFSVSSGISHMPTEVIEMEGELKRMNCEKEMLVKGLSRQHAMVHELKKLFNAKNQELSKILECVKECQTSAEPNIILNTFLTDGLV